MIPNYNPYLMQNQYGQNLPTQPQSPFISVRSEAEARNYPVAYGNSVTFKDENSPYVYCKTVFSQFDKPMFEKYRLVKEDSKEDVPRENYSKELEIQIEALWKEIESLKEKKRSGNEHSANSKPIQTKSNRNVIEEI